MKKLPWLSFSILLLSALGASPPIKTGPQTAKVSIKTNLDKTALWVGDTLTYTIQAIHDRDLEFALDNLKKDHPPLSPFVVRHISIHQGEWVENKRILEVTLLLSTYETGKTELTIPSFNLYYFIRAAGMGKKESSAEAVQVPATKVGLRSTLISGQLTPRDSKPVAATDSMRGWIALLLGLAGTAFLTVRSLRWVRMNLHIERPTRRRLSRQARIKFVQENLARFRAIRGESPEDLTHFYTQVSQFLRQYLSQCLEIEAIGLTPEEIETSVRTTNDSLAQQIRAILEQCDQVRYGKDGLRFGQEHQTELLEAVARVVTSPVS